MQDKRATIKDVAIEAGVSFSLASQVLRDDPNTTKRESTRRKIFDAANKLVQTVETKVTSDLDESILPKEPLVSGPAYDRNTDATDASGKITMRDESACPV